MKTLYVTDMDGTLLNNGSFVSERSSQIISELSEDGALITVATARTPATVVPLMQGTLTTVPYIVFTGAATYDPVKRRFAHKHIVPPDRCMMLYECFAIADVHPFVYHYTSGERLLVWHDPALTDAERSFYLERAHLQLKRFTFEPVASPYSDVALFFGVGPQEKLRPLAERIEAFGRFSVSYYPDIFNPSTMMIEVFDHGISKASAVKQMATHLGADRIVAFGDNINDIPMLEVADLSVAVANANPRVLDIAHLTIGPNYDDSVAKFIRSDFYTTH